MDFYVGALDQSRRNVKSAQAGGLLQALSSALHYHKPLWLWAHAVPFIGAQAWNTISAPPADRLLCANRLYSSEDAPKFGGRPTEKVVAAFLFLSKSGNFLLPRVVPLLVQTQSIGSRWNNAG
jgi:hypothetical protein